MFHSFQLVKVTISLDNVKMMTIAQTYFNFLFFLADYQETGFLAFQYAVDLAVIKHFNSSSAVDLFDLFLKKMPYPPYTKDNLTTILQMYLPFFLILGFILSALQTTKAIVYEKEKKLKV